MGITINNRTLTASKMLTLPQPVVLCVSRADFEKAITEAQFYTLSLNLPLAKALSGKPAKELESGITGIVTSIMPKGKAIYLNNFEILFDPRYKLNVIKLFCEISRHNKLIVKWCGVLENGNLTFAEPGYKDYNKYKISDYQISCVV